MTLGDRLKTLRRELGLSQEAIGAQGFVSTPGWIKIENGQRQASEKYMKATAASTLREELLTLKYLGSRSLFVKEMAKKHAKSLPNATAILHEDPAGYRAKPRRGRPAKNS